MSQTIMDQYHRAVRRFAEELSDTKEATKLRTLIAKSARAEEQLSSVYFDVTIDDEWIDRIERSLPHLEAAIREDRQFIKSEGNVTPIERVRKVSRASVEHLARHSEMITHVPDEGDDLIPDKLKVYENESNFAVYENRVLYMVLCYTRDFLDYRYFRIMKAWNERSSEMSFKKELRMEGRKVSFETKLSDQSAGMTDEEERTARKVARIESAVSAVAVLLAMPLMKEVSFAPMVTPPITRTNVLRMDVHFKEVVALYDFLSTYSGDGFTLKRHENSKSPFPEDMEREITELMMTAMYLNYKYGKNAADELEERYLAEEEQKRVAAFLEREERIRKLRESLPAGDSSSEEYLRILDEEIHIREEQIAGLRGEISKTDTYKNALTAAEGRESDLKNQLERFRKESGEAARRADIAQNEERMRQQKLSQEVAMLRQQLTEETERSRLYHARMLGMMEQFGVSAEEDFSNRDAFLELEKEREALERVYQRNWKKAKKKIRRRILWGKKEES